MDEPLMYNQIWLLGTGRGDRDTRVQSKFRNELLKVSCAERDEGTIWCCILSRWQSTKSVKAVHIFSYRHGQPMMDSNFGREDLDEPELFSPHNGILMDAKAEARLDKGLFVIVPRITDTSSPAEIALWNASESTKYIIRVVDPEHPDMNHIIHSKVSSKRWKELDGQEVSFKSDFRPRARYFYFHYYPTMLRRSWVHSKPANVLMDELGRRFWGGLQVDVCLEICSWRLLKKMGHDYDALLEGTQGGGESQEEETVETALVAANDAIRFSSSEGDELFTYALEESDDDDNEEP
ncbi:hypothetical protein MMC22_008988 [Lobaria immixta]|nr:hypothetical protein [Lobaria immixta]